MTKQEFDKASAEAGFGPCVDYMWPEIEDCYSTSDEIDRALMVDIYWHEPVIYHKILKLRRDIADGGVGLEMRSEGYRFPETRAHITWLANLWKRLDEVIAEAKQRAEAREKARA